METFIFLNFWISILNPSRVGVWIPGERQGGGLNQPPHLYPILKAKNAPMGDFLSSGHLNSFIGIGFDGFFICIPQKMTH